MSGLHDDWSDIVINAHQRSPSARWGEARRSHFVDMPTEEFAEVYGIDVEAVRQFKLKMRGFELAETEQHAKA
jgi:hypothetical protein